MTKINLLGVLGGLGPASSAYLYELITAHTKARCDQEHIDMIISSHATTPDRTAFIMGESDESPLPTMISDARRLEAYGAEAVVIACNTAHYFIEEVRRALSVPVPSIISETAAFARHCAYRRVSVMATAGTVASRSYQHALDELGVEWVLPDEDEQRVLTELIYESVKAGRALDAADFYEVAHRLESRGAEAHILGCTELSVINSCLPHERRFLDSTEVLAYTAIRLCGRETTGFADEYAGFEPDLGV